jgi:protein-disulfide isomerase
MIILYSTNCSRCKVLETKLKNKNIEYETVNDIDTMIDLGIKSAPALCVNNELLSYKEAIDWVNNYQEATNED